LKLKIELALDKINEALIADLPQVRPVPYGTFRRKLGLPAVVKVKDLYDVGECKGFPQWRCKLCSWDSLVSEDEMVAHIMIVHILPPSPEEAISAAGDRR